MSSTKGLSSPDQSAQTLRAALIGLAALAVLGVATELALIGHWKSTTQLAPWAVLLGTAVSLVVVAKAPTRRRLFAARAYTLVAALAAWWGTVEHLTANSSFAQELHPTWSRPHVLWAGLSGGVPALAPLAVALPGLLVAAATIHHPALLAATKIRACAP
jgi:hypothetical protein